MVSIDWSNTGAIDVEMDGSQFLTKKSPFKILVLTFSSKLD